MELLRLEAELSLLGEITGRSFASDGPGCEESEVTRM